MKEVKDLHTENSKTLIKETKMTNIFHAQIGKKRVDWKSIVKMPILLKAIYRFQCNPYQNTSGIFHRTRTSNPKICMEP